VSLWNANDEFIPILGGPRFNFRDDYFDIWNIYLYCSVLYQANTIRFLGLTQLNCFIDETQTSKVHAFLTLPCHLKERWELNNCTIQCSVRPRCHERSTLSTNIYLKTPADGFARMYRAVPQKTRRRMIYKRGASGRIAVERTLDFRPWSVGPSLISRHVAFIVSPPGKLACHS